MDLYCAKKIKNERTKNKILEQKISRLEKHKNDLGDLLAKREEQLDKIKDVVNKPTKYYDNDNFSDSVIRNIEIKQILEEKDATC